MKNVNEFVLKVARKAVMNPENYDADGNLDWNYVDGDVYIDASIAGVEMPEHSIVEDIYDQVAAELGSTSIQVGLA